MSVDPSLGSISLPLAIDVSELFSLLLSKIKTDKRRRGNYSEIFFNAVKRLGFSIKTPLPRGSLFTSLIT